jgi:integrase
MPTAKQPPIAITKDTLNKLDRPTKEEGRKVYWDAKLKGFGIRVNPTGSIVFVVQYRAGGRKTAATRTLTIGKYGSPWTPDTARLEARKILEGVHLGRDPAAERSAAEAEARKEAEDEAHYDFDAFADRYVAHVSATGMRSLRDIEGTFDRDLRPAFKGQSVRRITLDEIKSMRTKVGDRSHSAANKAHKWLSAALAWGAEHDGLGASPMIGLKKPYKETRRTRLLADWEIAVVWSVLPLMTWQFAMLMRMLLLTGQRLREVAGIRWEEIDFEKKEWIIPGARTKNKLTHLVPIVPQLERLLLEIEPDPERRRGLLLTTNGRTPISGFSKSKEEMDELVAKALGGKRWSDRGPVLPWVRHDTRRTFSTGCGEMGVSLEHAEAVLNHVSGTLSGVAGTYWLYKYAKEKRVALTKWANRVDRILKKHGINR